MSVVTENVIGVLEQVVKNRGRDVHRYKTCFHCKELPAIALRDYFNRIRDYSGASEECYVLACIFMDRLAEREESLKLDSFNAYRLVLISVMLAAKLHDDRYYSNEYYSRIAGISLEALDALELAVLKTLSFDLFVSPEQYEAYLSALLEGDLGKGPFILSHRSHSPSSPSHLEDTTSSCADYSSVCLSSHDSHSDDDINTATKQVAEMRLRE